MRQYTTSEPPNSYDKEGNTKRNEEPSLDWQRRWQIHKLHKYNRRHITKKDYPQWYLDNPTEYNTPKRPLPESTTPETYFHDSDFNCDPYYNPQLYDKTTLTFKHQECTPFEEYIRKTGMNISTEPRHRSKTVQPIPNYDQDAEHVTEIIVDLPQDNLRPILKNQGSHATAPHSPSREQSTNPIRAGIIRSPTMDVAPDSHQHKDIAHRTTNEAVDLAQNTHNPETITSKPTTKCIKRSLLLEPPTLSETQVSHPILNSQLEDDTDFDRHIIADVTNMQSGSPSGAANGAPQQDTPRSYLPQQTAEYPRNNESPTRETNVYPSLSSRQTENEVEDPRPLTSAATNTQSGFPPGVVNDSPSQDEPQSYPLAQIAEFLTRDPITKEECIPIFSAVSLKKKKKMLFAPMDFQDLTLDALIDSGALVNCISETDYNKIIQMSPKDVVKELEPPPFKLQVANGDIETPTKTIILQFEIGDWNFKETFIVAKRLTGPILGLTFLKNNSAILDVSQGLLHFPHLTYSIETDEYTRNRKLYKVQIKNPLTIPPETTQTITGSTDTPSNVDTTGVINPATNHCSGDPLVVASSISTASNRKIDIRVTNTTPTPFTIKRNTTIAEFKILSPEEAKELRPLNTAALKVLTEDDSEEALVYINELLKTSEKPSNNQNFWFPTPDNPGDPSTHTPIQSRILREIKELEEIQKLDPNNNTEDREVFLKNFKWDDSQLTENDQKDIEEILIEFNDIFARHRLDIGINHDFKIKLTPKTDDPVYSQSLPCPINLKEDLTVELALMHYFGIITTLPFSKYASPIFAQRKPNGRLRLLVDLRKINNLISDDYINNNHPVSTLTVAAQHLAGKKLFCKLDCSQAYHVLQMADQKSVQLLAFNFASRTFAYLRLAQGLSRSLSSFSSFMREYLDKAIKADKCAQYVDDIGIATNTPEELKNNLREVFQCIRAAGLRLTMAKCQFGAKEVEFLGRTISPAGVAPQSHKIQKHLQTIKFPRTKKGLQRYIGFVNYYRNYIPRLSEKIAPFHELIKSDKPVKIDQDLISNFEDINKSLDNACGLWLKQPLPNRQYVLMTDASFKNAGYALMTEEDPEQKITSTKKTYAPVAFGSKTFSPSQLKMSIYAKEFLAIYFAFMEYSHILWGSSKPTIVLTDNKSVTRFFQTKMIPPSLWNACDFVLQFHFKIAHVPGRMNTAADFLSRLDISPKEKVLLQIREDIQTTPIQVNIQSSDIHEEDQFYFLPEDDSETEEDIWERKQQARKQIYSPYKKSTDPMNETDQTISQPENLPLVCNNIQDPEQEQRRLLHNDTSFPRSLRPHQDQDPVLRNLKLKILKEPYDTQLLNDDPRAAKYLTQDDRIIIKDGLLYRQYFGDTGKVKYLQVLLPQQLVDEFIQHHHGKFGKHPGIAKTIQQCREKYYFPGLAARIATHITQCPECAQTKRTPNANITPPLIDMSKVALGPEDALQMDIVPFDDPSGGYTAVITAMDVFSRYLFAYSVARVDTKTVTRVLTDIITRHCYLPTTIITDKGSQFISEAMQQTTAVLGIQLKHATTKHAQTIGILEKTHASLKESLKIMTGERRTMWHQFLPMAVLNYNTSYHTSLGCEPSRVFHGRVPYNVLDLKYGIKPQASSTINHEIAEGVLKQTQQILNNSQQALMQAYVRHKRYYDRKASAHPLVVNDYCYALHPKAHSQATKLPFREYLWTGPYIVVKTLPNNNYLIRKLQTNFTQILHRIRLRPFASSQKLPDITVPPKDYQQDTEVTIQHDDLFARAWEELYNECPPQPENKQSPEPEIILPTPVTDNAPTHPEPPSPNLAYEPEPTPTYPSDQAQDPTVDLDDIPEENTDTPKSPRKSQYNLRRNPTSNWKPDYAYYNALTANSTSPAQSTGSLDDDPEFQVLADLGPDGSPRSEN